MDEGMIHKLREIVLMLNLERDIRFDSTSLVQLSYVYNGMGPDSWEPHQRKALSKVFRKILPAVLVHDWDFAMLERTDDNFHLANDRLENNANAIILGMYGSWYYWFHRRYYLNAIPVIAMACRSFKGKEAWDNGQAIITKG